MTLDINPSVALGLNKANEVVKVTAVDERSTQGATAEAFIKDFENTFELTDAINLPIGFLITDQQTLKRAIEKEIATSLLTLDPTLNSPQKISAYMAVEDNLENLADHVQWLDEDDFEDLLDLIYADVPIDESKDNDDDSDEDSDDENKDDEIISETKDNSAKIASNDDDDDETRTEEDEDVIDNAQSATEPFHKAAVKSSDKSTSDDDND